jgi:hypothetical protein
MSDPSDLSTHSNWDVRSAEFNKETWDQDQAGYWYPIQDKDSDDDELGNAEPSDEEGKQE